MHHTRLFRRRPSWRSFLTGLGVGGMAVAAKPFGWLGRIKDAIRTSSERAGQV